MKQLFNQLISFPYFFKIAQISFPYLFLLSILVILLGVLWGVFFSPVDVTQGEVYRIIYLHVPAASVAQSIYYTMVIASITYLIWRIKMASVFMISMAPLGAIFTFLALFTGAVWGQPTWGTWWVWDARLTSTLILLILYLAIISLFSSFDRRASTDQAVSIVVLIGGINLPIIKLSVEWWNTLHQSASITLSGCFFALSIQFDLAKSTSILSVPIDIREHLLFISNSPSLIDGTGVFKIWVEPSLSD